MKKFLEGIRDGLQAAWIAIKEAAAEIRDDARDFFASLRGE